MRAHPIADLFPLARGQAFEDFKNDIRKHGQRSPVVLYDGQILDGRNRWRACQELGIDPVTVTHHGDEASARALSVSANLHRRHLTESQRAMIAARLANMPPHRPTSGSPPIGALTSQSEAAALCNVSKRLVQRAAAVVRSGAPELVTAVAAGHVKLESAARIAQETHEEQRRIVARSFAPVRRRPAPGVAPKVVPAPSEPAPRVDRRRHNEKHDTVRALTEQGFTVSDIASQTGMTKNFIHHAKSRFVKRAGSLCAVVQDVEIFAESWAARASEPSLDAKWRAATPEERSQLVDALSACRAAAQRMIQRLRAIEKGDRACTSS